MEEHILETIRKLVREESSALAADSRRARTSEQHSDDRKRRRFADSDDYRGAQCKWCGDILHPSVTYQMHNTVCLNNPLLQRTCYVCETSMHRSEISNHQRRCRRRCVAHTFEFLTSRQLDDANFCIELLHAARNTTVLETVRNLVNNTMTPDTQNHTEMVVHGILHSLLTLWRFNDSLDRWKLRHTFARYMKNTYGCSPETVEALPLF